MHEDILIDAWEHKEGPIILSTVDTKGMPNSMYATCTRMSEDGKIVIADNYFHKTRDNIGKGSYATVLFMTTDGRSFQAKGTLSLEHEGPYVTFMKSWNPTKHPGRAAAVMTIIEVYSGAERLV